VINMLRQVGLAVGVAVFVAIVGSPVGPRAAHTAFQHGWYVISAIAVLAAGVGVVSLRPRPPAADTLASPVVGDAAQGQPSVVT